MHTSQNTFDAFFHGLLFFVIERYVDRLDDAAPADHRREANTALSALHPMADGSDVALIEEDRFTDGRDDRGNSVCRRAFRCNDRIRFCHSLLLECCERRRGVRQERRDVTATDRCGRPGDLTTRQCSIGISV